MPPEQQKLIRHNIVMKHSMRSGLNRAQHSEQNPGVRLRKQALVFLIAAIAGLAMSVQASATPLTAVNPAILGNQIYVSGQGISNFKISANSQTKEGKANYLVSLNWTALSDTQVYAPLVLDNQIVAGSDMGLFSLSPDTGEVLWSIETGSSFYSPAVTDNQKYLIATNRAGKIYKLHSRTGEIIWQKNLTGWQFQPVIHKQLAITGGQSGTLTGINLENGQIAWQVPVGQELIDAPLLFSDQILVTTYRGDLLIINPTSGNIDQLIESGIQMTNAAIIENKAYLNGLNGGIYLLNSNKPEASLTRIDELEFSGVAFPAAYTENNQLSLADSYGRVILLTQESHLQLNLNLPIVAGPIESNGQWLIPVQRRHQPIELVRLNWQPGN